MQPRSAMRNGVSVTHRRLGRPAVAGLERETALGQGQEVGVSTLHRTVEVPSKWSTSA